MLMCDISNSWDQDAHGRHMWTAVVGGQVWSWAYSVIMHPAVWAPNRGGAVPAPTTTPQKPPFSTKVVHFIWSTYTLLWALKTHTFRNTEVLAPWTKSPLCWAETLHCWCLIKGYFRIMKRRNVLILFFFLWTSYVFLSCFYKAKIWAKLRWVVVISTYLS